MAKLPTSLDLGQRPVPQAARGASTYQVPTGGEVAAAEAASQVGGMVLGIADKWWEQEQLRQDRIRAEDATNKLSQSMIDLSIGDDGFSNKKGEAAVTQPLYKDYLSKFDDVSRQLASTLGNERQKDEFNQRYNIARRQFQTQILNHVTRENDVYQTNVAKDTVDTEVRKAGVDAFNPVTAEMSLVRINATIEAEAKRKGLPKETVDDLKAQAFDKVWISRLDGMRMTDPVKAIAAYQENAHLLSPNVRQKAGESLFRDAKPVLEVQVSNLFRNATAPAPAEPGKQQEVPAPPVLFAPPKILSPRVQSLSPIIKDAAQKYGVDPNILAAQIQQESVGRTDALSVKNARGVSQFIPETAKRYGVNPSDDRSSIDGQARYMADMLKMFNGDYAKALAGYNMGENEGTPSRPGVAGLVKAHGDQWFSRVPYKETSGYVKTILNNVGVNYNGESVTAPAKQDSSTINSTMPDGWGPTGGSPKVVPGMIQPGNIDLTKRAVAKNSDGSISTVRSMGVNIDGKEVLIPTVINGRLVSDDEAISHYKKTGENLGVFDSAKASDAYAEKLHEQQKKMYGNAAGGIQPATSAKEQIEAAMFSPEKPIGNAVIDRLPLDQKIQVLHGAAALTNKDNSELKARVKDATLNAMASALNTGNAGNAPSQAEMVAALGSFEGNKLWRQFSLYADVGKKTQGMNNMSDGELGNLVRSVQPPPGDPEYDVRSKLSDHVLTAANNIRRLRQSDPVEFALSTTKYGIQPLTPDDFKAPALMVEKLQAREKAAPAISEDYQTPMAVMTKGEAGMLAEAIRRSPVEAQKEYLLAIRQGFTKPGMYETVMEKLAPGDPMLALAGAALSEQKADKGGNLLADYILRGDKILRPDKKADGSNPERGKALIEMPKEEEWKPVFDRMTDTAYQYSPQARSLAIQRAMTVYAAMASDRGIFDGKLDAEVFRTAVTLSSGGYGSYNNKKVVLPFGMPLDEFKNGVDERLRILQPTTGLSLQELRGLKLFNDGDGKYTIARGTGVVRNIRDGMPVVIDFSFKPPPYVPPSTSNPDKFSETRGGAATGRVVRK
jgi:soluble lytic murein transglycosylase-like protein